ncbi:hypothetical protein GCM10012275_24310 [Longimycelium tulufanense]|uniref:Uncharacterized protein n=1 Tax=Longimycelium tulufanense TaxID=907463 RepID=A0A8J3CCB6_9PSEU|nr:class I SAM-dependent methyltransferase [Longimycelium tulufanense]GGM52480.1 hypothetical protein GCM10012275_24310 [Longimycelium tulufanense]
MNELVPVMDPLGPDYERAFSVFLEHTNQKDRERGYLADVIAALPARGLVIDAGAGIGTTTAWLASRFDNVLAIEPNPHLRTRLVDNCPQAKVLVEPILDARPGMLANLVLCSHVFYYIPQEEWLDHLDTLASWLAPGGEAVVALQHPCSDCMWMLCHFTGRRFNLAKLAKSFAERKMAGWSVSIDTVPATIRTPNVATAVRIAEFVLNSAPLADPPKRDLLRDYVHDNFADLDGRCQFSCTQDFLRVRRDA